MDSSGETGKPHSRRSSVVCASATSVASYPRTSAPCRGRPDALLGLGAGDHHPPDPALGEPLLEVAALERVGVGLVDQRLGVEPLEPVDVLPRVGAAGHLVVGVRHPDHRHLLRPGLVDEDADVGDDPVALVRLAHDAVLDVDD